MIMTHVDQINGYTFNFRASNSTIDFISLCNLISLLTKEFSPLERILSVKSRLPLEGLLCPGISKHKVTKVVFAFVNKCGKY